MAGNPNRSQRLGDIGANAPGNWSWGVGDREPHVLLMLFSATGAHRRPPGRGAGVAAERSGLALIEELRTTDMGGVEPFGFADGVSQPTFDWDRARTPGTKADRAYTNLLALGEILLGYYNEYGFPAELPKVAAGERRRRSPASRGGRVGRPGPWKERLVSRLSPAVQDVPGFWRWVAKEAAHAGLDAQALAETMVGRRMGGAPLRRLRNRPRPAGRRSARPGAQRFPVRQRSGRAFLPDRRAYPARQSPHRRRARPGRQARSTTFWRCSGLTTRRLKKPTSSTLPWEKNTTVWPYLRHEDDAIASARFHRILRRGREYGAKIDLAAALDPSTPDPGAGLQFICLNANIARQFEFVQGAWIANAKFAALTGEQDPLLGNREPFPRPADQRDAAAHRRLHPSRGGTQPPEVSRPAAIRHRAWRRLFLSARAGGAEVDRERLMGMIAV